MRTSFRMTVGVIALAALAAPAWAQQTVGNYTINAFRKVRIAENEWALVGSAEIHQGDTSLYADEIDLFEDEHRAVARGNVLLSQGDNRIGGDSADFDLKTSLGTFHHAYGIANIQQQRQTAPATPGAFVAPQRTGQPTDVYFFGETVEKIGPKKYKITNGGFTTCLQPTPRWNLTASTVVLHVNHYTLLKQAVLNVKGVPLLYLPFMYYPTKEDDRATGFLIPVYGSGTLRGQSILNQFFWAIDRSQDLTIMHDWFSKGAQGFGSEYRYNWGGGSAGNLQSYFLNQSGDQASTGLQQGHSFTLRGNATQTLPGRLRASANVYYFSSLTSNQSFNVNLLDASSNNRQYTINVVGPWRNYAFNAMFLRSESFYDSTSSTVQGSTPRITLSRAERPLLSTTPLYFTASSEFAHLDSESKTTDLDIDKSVTRLDFSPQVRFPFRKWQFFTVNSSVSWHDTFYTRSLDPADTSGNTILNEPVNRQYFVLQAQATGPVFTRMFNTPGMGYAEKFKHTIEPTFTAQRTTSIDELLFNRIVKSDSGDFALGSTNLTYALNNYLYAKRKVGQTSQSQEILRLTVSQTYYTNQNAAVHDLGYQTSVSATPSNFSPVKVNVTGRPTTSVNGTLQAEFDSRTRDLRYMSVNGGYNWSTRVQSSVGWFRNFSQAVPGGSDHHVIGDSLNLQTSAQTSDNRFGGRYSLLYNLLASSIGQPSVQQQRISVFYNAQCCGIAVDYSSIPFYGGVSGATSNHTFFISLTLAGLGSVSPFSGGLAGLPGMPR